MYVTSPGGYECPRALAWDMAAEDLELALEWTNDVGEVTVSYAEAVDGTRSYQVTFDVRVHCRCTKYGVHDSPGYTVLLRVRGHPTVAHVVAAKPWLLGVLIGWYRV